MSAVVAGLRPRLSHTVKIEVPTLLRPKLHHYTLESNMSHVPSDAKHLLSPSQAALGSLSSLPLNPRVMHLRLLVGLSYFLAYVGASEISPIIISPCHHGQDPMQANLASPHLLFPGQVPLPLLLPPLLVAQWFVASNANPMICCLWHLNLTPSVLVG